MKASLIQTDCSHIFLLLLVLAASSPGTSRGAERLVPSQYPNIQAAVDAASSGDTIRIAAGHYFEQVIISTKNNLTLVGTPPDTTPGPLLIGGPAIESDEAGTVLYAMTGMSQTLQPNTSARAVLGVLRSDNITVRGITFDGQHLGGLDSPAILVGVFYVSSSGLVEKCTIRGFRAESGGYGARGYCGWNPARPLVLEVAVVNSSFQDNGYSIVLGGNDSNAPSLHRLQFKVEGNSFTGLGASAPFFQHGGIFVTVGAEGSIIGNAITDHVYNGFEDGAFGIAGNDGGFRQRGYFLPIRPVVFSGNVFSNNTAHLVTANSHRSTITNNVFLATASESPWAALTLSGENIAIADNNFANCPEAIRLWGANDAYADVPVGIAKNIDIFGTWFTNVTTTIQTGELATFDEIGTELCCFAPEFQALELSDDSKIHARVRSWHNSPLVIESSPDLKNWSALGTNTPALPVFQFADTETRASARFYRARNK